MGKSAFSGTAQTYVELGLKPTSRAKSLPEDGLSQPGQATDTSAHTTKSSAMMRQTRNAYVGKNGLSFPLQLRKGKRAHVTPMMQKATKGIIT